jgi:hypothetical protein
MADSFVDGCYRMVDAMAADPRLEIVELEFGPPLAHTDYEALCAAAGRSLPACLQQLYGQANGVRLAWRHQVPGLLTGDERDTGSIDILPLQEVLQDWRGKTGLQGPDGWRFAAVRPVDFFSPEACACLMDTPDGGVAPTVHFHQLGVRVCDTGYDLDAYLERLLQARGAWGWVESLCAETAQGPQARDFIVRAGQLFDGFQAAPFVPASA